MGCQSRSPVCRVWRGLIAEVVQMGAVRLPAFDGRWQQAENLRVGGEVVARSGERTATKAHVHCGDGVAASLRFHPTVVSQSQRKSPHRRETMRAAVVPRFPGPPGTGQASIRCSSARWNPFQNSNMDPSLRWDDDLFRPSLTDRLRVSDAITSPGRFRRTGKPAFEAPESPATRSRPTRWRGPAPRRCDTRCGARKHRRRNARTRR